MRFYPLLAFVASASTAAIPDVEAQANGGSSSPSCKADNREIAISKAAFLKAKVIPPRPSQYNDKVNVIPSFNPDATIAIDYNGKQVEYGTKFQTTETTLQPNVVFTAESDLRYADYNYTVIIADPDALSPAGTTPGPLLKNYLHWIYYDAKPCLERKQQPSAKDQPMYAAPTPPSPQAHRYTFLVYRQPKGVYTPPNPATFPQTLGASRGMFDVNGYVKAGRLEGPVAGNYFLEAAPVGGGS
ncbi:hypothetical protein M409DRAFT_27739 [Zasmidium cellare ATCC 36951]|uniref:Phosphatidylethanolamine-binding protein n=1 Tax=Zasmidium cellare ATCC 36951 TaxID=1080233 RepID=A0A6A6C4G9_ZASCE|nr:uncharacterized protein M409DRAFT_27739 [Zasmidium cellare ATCC 36951]KAF2162014.1 hypothetical protein M409DRAFT_27739 [Zasmidium cellare ATCC 36951]